MWLNTKNMMDTKKQTDRLSRIRQNEAASHTEVYTHEKLYASDTWLKKPIKTVQDIMPSFSDYNELHVLDLGCGVGRNSINGITTPIEEFAIPTAEYDLILAVSALEHIDTKQHFIGKLHEIAHGIKKNGIVCLVINSDITEVDAETGASLEPNFEVNLKSDQIMTYLDGIFEGWTVVKKTVVAQEYEIPRDNMTSQLTTKVISFVAENKII